jgi:tetratricopeptide (TPR) repeat protein
MKKMMEMIMVLAIIASVNAAGHASDASAKEEKGVHAQAKGHVCFKSIDFQANALAGQGKNEDAIKMLEDAKGNAEYEHHYELLFPSLVKLYEKTGQYEKSIALWNEGHKKNMTFGLDPRKEEFKPYLKLEGFKEAVKKDQELTRSKAKPQLKKEDCEETKTEIKRIEKKEVKKDIKEKR